MVKYKKEVERTYFNVKKTVSIEEVNLGDSVFLEVNSPFKYGVRTLHIHGEIRKITKDYFWILLYHNPFPNITNWSTEQIRMKRMTPEKYTKKWAKKSIVKIQLIDLENKFEIVEFEDVKES